MTPVTGPVVSRRVPTGSVPRDCARIPAVRLEAGWSVQIEGRWYEVVSEPLLVGDGLDEDGGRVRLRVTGPGVAVVDLATFRRGERVWARAPQPGALAVLGCADPDCVTEGPFELVGSRLWCLPCLADRVRDALLAETAGPDDDGEAGPC